MPWYLFEDIGPGVVNKRGLFPLVYVPKLSEEQWTKLVQQWYVKGYIIYKQMCDLFMKETPCTVDNMFDKQDEMVSFFPPPEKKTVNYISIYDLPDGHPFMLFSDLKLTYGDGLCLFTKEQVLGEIERHQSHDILYKYIEENIAEDVLISL